MYQKYILVLFIAITNSVSFSFAQNKPGKVRAYNRSSIPTPPGMEYIPGGSIVMKYNNQIGDTSGYKQVSLSPFFIDKTEVTNKQYREFVNWVADSIAVTNYLKDEKYFTSSNRDSVTKFINWKKVGNGKPLWQTNSSDIQNRLQPMFEHGEIKRDILNFTYTRLKTSSDGKTSRYVTEVVNVYPDNKTWATDFPNSQTDMMVRAYFTSDAFDDYPVVGVTWEQAQAYAHWRSMRARQNNKKNKYALGYDLPFTLPSEAQWVYAALGELSFADVDSFRIPRDNKDRLVANFKQSEGEYTQDGSSYTVHVMSYKPNQFGLYNMMGNVAEWVLDAYNESAWAFVHDQNPVLLYDADNTEPDVMKRKVVRGGSWKDNAQALSPYTRSFETQNVPHSYIGFRCVMPAPEILTNKVETRNK
jgi:formylglycine-generating enzyme